MNNEIQVFCNDLARQGVRGKDLLAKASSHFAEPATLVGILMDGSVLGGRLIAAMRAAIGEEILRAVINANGGKV